jgi:hypothetical protein
MASSTLLRDLPARHIQLALRARRGSVYGRDFGEFGQQIRSASSKVRRASGVESPPSPTVLRTV